MSTYQSWISSYHDYSINPNSCSYYSIEDFNQKFKPNKKFFLLNFNIRSFNSNFDDFACFVSQLAIQPDAIVLTETWFTGQFSSSITGYTGYHCNRNFDCLKAGGGISIYMRNTVKSKITVETEISSTEIELMHIKMTEDKQKTTHILGIYRPPNTSLIDAYLQKLDEVLERIPVTHRIIISGDLNINGLCFNNPTVNFMDTMKTYNMIPHVLLPTRPNRDGFNATQIDHILSNIPTPIQGGVFDGIFITDHFPNFALIPLEYSNNKVKKTFRDHSETCINTLIDRITNFVLFFPLLTATLDFNSKFNLFYDEMLRIYKSSCPLRTKTLSINNIQKPWITRNLKIKIARKHYLFKRYKKGVISYTTFNNFKIETEKLLKTAKRDYFFNKFATSNGDSRAMWKITNNLLGNNIKPPTTFSIEHAGQLIDNDKKISEIFNSYFIDVGSNLANGINITDTHPISYLGPRNNCTFLFDFTDQDEVFNLIQGFQNKSCSPNNLPIFIIKKVSHIIAPIIADLFNESVTSGLFPDKLKVGRVIPIYKSGVRTHVSNYRPITTLSVFSKVFEKLVHRRLVSFLERYNILNKNQFGFQKGKSTSDAILEYLDNANDAINNKNVLLSVFLDFSKAFDTISFDILLAKMDHYGLRGVIKSWLKSYLYDRRQYVEIGEYNSMTLNTIMGVPQGSTLGPLLFLVYIADMQRALDKMLVIHYADDSTLYLRYSKNQDVSNLINIELQSLSNWLSANKLFLNIQKTKYMIVHNRSDPVDLNICIGNSAVQRTDEHKFLGVYLDQRLTFASHTSKICSKIARNIGIIRKISFNAPCYVLRKLHYAFIHSQYTYAITAYGSATVSVTKKLSNLVEKSLKLVLGVRRITLDLCKHKKIFNFPLAHQFFVLIKMHQILANNSHQYFFEKIQNTQIRHSHNTRFINNLQLTIPLMRFTKCQNSFIYTGLQFWNKLPTSLRVVINENSFKTKLKRYLLS